MKFQKALTIQLLVILSLVAGSTGCALYAPKPRTKPPMPMPEAFELYQEGETVEDRWWESFGSEELNRLVDMGLKGSLSLQQTWARLMQQQAIADSADSATLPGIDYEARATAKYQETPAGADSDPVLSAGLSASYEIDLWGRVKSVTTAAQLDMQVSREDYKTAMTTLVGNITLAWLDIISYRKQIASARRQLEDAATMLSLLELRYRNGLATALDVLQQRQALEGKNAALPPLESQLKLREQQLAVLVGKMPGTDLNIRQTEFPLMGNLPDVGLPADLLARRPDVRGAGYRLQAADWRVSAAKADRLPAIRLTAGVSYTAAGWSPVFNNWIASLAASITGPLFDGGRRAAEVERTKAVVDERLAAYKETVIAAVQEVEGALHSEMKQREYVTALRRQEEASRIVWEESLFRYRQGLETYFQVLSAQNEWQRLQQSLVTAESALLGDRVALYRALGGDWTSRALRSKLRRKEKEREEQKRNVDTDTDFKEDPHEHVP